MRAHVHTRRKPHARPAHTALPFIGGRQNGPSGAGLCSAGPGAARGRTDSPGCRSITAGVNPTLSHGSARRSPDPGPHTGLSGA